MTYYHVGKSIQRLESEYNKLTNFSKQPNINSYFNIHNVKVSLHQKVNHGRGDCGMIINTILFSIQRKTNHKLNLHLMNRILPEDISNKVIKEYLNELDVLSFEIDLEYDLSHFPFQPPLWNLVSLSNNGFIPQTEKAIKILVKSHNKLLQNDWCCALSFVSDLNYFLSKIIKLMNYI